MTLTDVELVSPPLDSISSLSFSGRADYLAAGSWDNSARIYEVDSQGKSELKASYYHNGAVLDICWNRDGNKLFSGGADHSALMYDVSTGVVTQIAQHEGPVKAVKWVDINSGILATGSWDKTIKYWDLRTRNPIATLQLPNRCYSMDFQNPFLVVGTAERQIQIYHLTNHHEPYKSMISPLKKQTRTVSCFKASKSSGFAIGSVEGRVAIHWAEENYSMNNYSFRCHRQDAIPGSKDQSLVFAVNDIKFHPIYGTFTTCGSDGTLHFWDKDSRTRLKSVESVGGTISAMEFNRTGTILAYAISYDWSKGHIGMTPGRQNRLMLHSCRNDEIKRRPRK